MVVEHFPLEKQVHFRSFTINFPHGPQLFSTNIQWKTPTVSYRPKLSIQTLPTNLRKEEREYCNLRPSGQMFFLISLLQNISVFIAETQSPEGQKKAKYFYLPHIFGEADLKSKAFRRLPASRGVSTKESPVRSKEITRYLSNIIWI